MHPTNLLIRKLECFHPLSGADRALLESISKPIIEIPARHDLVQEGETPENVFLIVSGFACRYKLTAEGRRQIMAFFVPGDFCDFQVFILNQMDHNIGTLSRCHVVEMSRQDIVTLTENPAIGRAFWWASLVDAAVLREWIVNLGQRSAYERIAHLLSELLIRLRVVGQVRDNSSYTLPITQSDLAETMGLTIVTANRVLMKLREKGLITVSGRELIIHDVKALERESGFDPKYLHLQQYASPL
ncbi:Crp/Fnr family transcriptional regulator [Aureimonas altamirensis]|uniref:Crp/Fnr family transcriptional regulator n=1 Tax=Aureimonas altamirensis TaxID=370622 RepID=UPI003018481A